MDFHMKVMVFIVVKVRLDSNVTFYFINFILVFVVLLEDKFYFIIYCDFMKFFLAVTVSD